MARLKELLEPGERIVLQHWPSRWVYIIVGVIAASDFATFVVVGWFMWSSGVPDGELLLLVTGGFAALSLALLPLMVGWFRLAVVTDRRVLVRDGMTWGNPKQIRRGEIEEARQTGSKFEIRSTVRSVEFPCPPQFARRILAALGREADGIA